MVHAAETSANINISCQRNHMAGHLVLVEKVKHEHNRPPERGALLQVVLLSSGNSASVVAAIIRVINVALLTQVSRVLLPLAVEGSQAVKGRKRRKVKRTSNANNHDPARGPKPSLPVAVCLLGALVAGSASL